MNGLRVRAAGAGEIVRPRRLIGRFWAAVKVRFLLSGWPFWSPGNDAEGSKAATAQQVRCVQVVGTRK